MVDATGDQQDRAVGPRRRRLLEEPGEHHDLDRALEVLERRDPHRGVGLGDHPPEPRDDPCDDEPLAIERLVLQIAAVGRHERADLLGDLPHRMLGQVEPEELLLPGEPLADGDLRRLREWPFERGEVGGDEVEQ